MLCLEGLRLGMSMRVNSNDKRRMHRTWFFMVGFFVDLLQHNDDHHKNPKLIEREKKSIQEAKSVRQVLLRPGVGRGEERRGEEIRRGRWGFICLWGFVGKMGVPPRMGVRGEADGWAGRGREWRE
ncbi:hypothetical protein Droror1_Dr00020031 [Drosera rotundifolia]